MEDTALIEVNYNFPLETMIGIAGNDWTDKNITAKKFPIRGTGVVIFESRLFRFDKTISSEDADKAIRKEDLINPWMSAEIEHTLFYGAKFPEKQRRRSILGLGSSARIVFNWLVPCLGRGGSTRRHLRLLWWGGGWWPSYDFLAVRQVFDERSFQ